MCHGHSIAYMYVQKKKTTDTPVSAEVSEYDRSIDGASDGSIDSCSQTSASVHTLHPVLCSLHACNACGHERLPLSLESVIDFCLDNHDHNHVHNSGIARVASQLDI